MSDTTEIPKRNRRSLLLKKKKKLHHKGPQLRSCTNNQIYEELKIKLIVFGYIRESLDQLIIPEPLIILISKFFERYWRFHKVEIIKDLYSISEDGLSVHAKEDAYISIPFGHFFSIHDKMVYKFLIKLGLYQNRGMYSTIGNSGIGFITEEFDEFDHTINSEYANGWNKGDNHSMLLLSNGWFVTSKDLDENARAYTTQYHQRWSSRGHEIMVKIDTKTMKVLIWNYTQTGIDDMKLDEYDKDNNYQYLFQLPMNKKISIVVMMGAEIEQSMSVLDQQFEYNE